MVVKTPELFRVVDTDNLGGDYPDERFVTTWALPKSICDLIAQWHNVGMNPYSSRYWKVVKDGYKLQPGFKP